MKQGWFIPVTLLCAGLSMAGLWFYLSAADTHIEPLGIVAPTGAPAPGHFATPLPVTDDATRDEALPNPAPGNILANSSQRITVARTRLTIPSPFDALRAWRDEWSEQIARTAAMLDEEAARLRGELRAHPVARLAAGRQLLNDGRAAQAVEAFERILKKEPDHHAALTGKAAALCSLRRYDQAAAVYAAILARRPDDAAAHYNVAVLHARLGGLGDAAGHLREAVRHDPGHARAWFNLATLAQRDGHLAESRRCWQEFTQLEPSIAAGWFNLGLVQMDFQKPEEAARSFSYVILIDPTDVDGYVNLASAYRASGDLESALAVLEQARALSDCDPVVLSAAADTHRAFAALHPESAAAHLAQAADLEAQLSPFDRDLFGQDLAADAPDE